MTLAGFVRLGIAGIFAAAFSVAWPQTGTGPDSDSSHSINAPGHPDQSAKQQAVMPPNQAPDKLFDLPRLKESRASLIGGTLDSIDRLRSRFVVRPFGQGKVTIAFDPRTQFVRGAEVAASQDMHRGDRVYVETVLDGTAVFAKTVHLPKDAAQGTTFGQIIGYDAAQGSLTIRDQLSSLTAKFRVTSKTTVTGAGLGPGALVQISFLPGEETPLVREIQVLAAPGSVFTFSGRITFLDLASHELVIANASDDKRYEIQFNPAAIEAAAKERLQEGASVTIAARFNGQGYIAESVTVLSRSTE